MWRILYPCPMYQLLTTSYGSHRQHTKIIQVSVSHFRSAFQIKRCVYIIFIFSSVFVYDNATNQITSDANDVVMRHKRVIKRNYTFFKEWSIIWYMGFNETASKAGAKCDLNNGIIIWQSVVFFIVCWFGVFYVCSNNLMLKLLFLSYFLTIYCWLIANCYLFIYLLSFFGPYRDMKWTGIDRWFHV